MRVDLIFLLILFLRIAPTSQAADIHEAAKNGDVAAITTALDAGADANASDGIATPLYYAIDRANLEAAKLLIAAAPTPISPPNGGRHSWWQPSPASQN